MKEKELHKILRKGKLVSKRLNTEDILVKTKIGDFKEEQLLKIINTSKYRFDIFDCIEIERKSFYSDRDLENSTQREKEIFYYTVRIEAVIARMYMLEWNYDVVTDTYATYVSFKYITDDFESYNPNHLTFLLVSDKHAKVLM